MVSASDFQPGSSLVRLCHCGVSLDKKLFSRGEYQFSQSLFATETGLSSGSCEEFTYISNFNILLSLWQKS